MKAGSAGTRAKERPWRRASVPPEVEVVFVDGGVAFQVFDGEMEIPAVGAFAIEEFGIAQPVGLGFRQSSRGPAEMARPRAESRRESWRRAG